MLSLKTIGPLAAFVSFLVFMIRWASAWARQHAEEEFRNRARILDIGRASWLLEAVRDAQDNDRELPNDLLKELARNLFSYNTISEGTDVKPNLVGDMVWQGLSSVRMKSPDGSEIEVARKNGKKDKD